MKLNWFAPLDEATSDSARRWREALPRLAERHQITFWSGAEDAPETTVAGAARVARHGSHDAPWAEINRADMSVYNLDPSSPACAAIWRLSQRHRGVVLLHADGLFDLFARLARSGADERDALLDSASRPAQRSDLERWLDAGDADPGDLATRHPCLDLATRGALGVVLANPRSRPATLQTTCPQVRADDDPERWPDDLDAVLSEAVEHRRRATAERVAALVATELGAWCRHAPAPVPSTEDEVVTRLIDPLRAAARALTSEGRALAERRATPVVEAEDGE